MEHSNDWTTIRQTYKIKGHLGEGSYGTVVLAKHRETKKEYAIKHLKDLPINSRDNSQRAKWVLRELQIMIGLSKINENLFTVKIHDVVIVGSPKTFTSLFIVMDYVEKDLGVMMNDKTL